MTQRFWITGSSRSGKTARLITQFCTWLETGLELDWNPTDRTLHRPIASPYLASNRVNRQLTASAILILAANGDNRLDLVDRLSVNLGADYPARSTTPLGFFEDEVMLFWPLLIQKLNLRAQFPIRLRPENEQELATHFWRSDLNRLQNLRGWMNESSFVRQTLDLWQLAALSGTPLEEIAPRLLQGLPPRTESEEIAAIDWSELGEMLLRWRGWCLARGLLTYGVLTELYWQQLLPDPTYQYHLARRYRAILADDVDEYPAIARPLVDVLLSHGVAALFTFNPEGAVRLGLGGDPAAFQDLADHCQIEALPAPEQGLAFEVGELLVPSIADPTLLTTELPETIQSIQEVSRAQMLRRTAEAIVEGVRSGQVQPQDIAIIAPGLDAIARYTLTEILDRQGITAQALHEQRPLASFPLIRAILTLLTLIYPGLGRLVDRDAIAEMLVVLSSYPGQQRLTLGRLNPETEDRLGEMEAIGRWEVSQSHPLIDAVRAGLIADHCFEPHPDAPQLLPVTAFPRWDRLGYQATQTYTALVDWINTQKQQQRQHLSPSVLIVLDRAIQHFLLQESDLPFDQLAALRELLETAQHYWEVAARLHPTPLDRVPIPGDPAATVLSSPSSTIASFIQLLRSGTITANPYPVRPTGTAAQAVTLANIFQYRSHRQSHRWQFWLDAGSPRWLTGDGVLFAAPLFLTSWSGQPWTTEDQMQAYEQRLRRVLWDLLSRTQERLYLCHSDLAVNGQEQTGPLLTLLNAVLPRSNEQAVGMVVKR